MVELSPHIGCLCDSVLIGITRVSGCGQWSLAQLLMDTRDILRFCIRTKVYTRKETVAQRKDSHFGDIYRCLSCSYVHCRAVGRHMYVERVPAREISR